ncbi:MAG: SBBP repeat-containing protein [Bacteroidales bacterium]|nr:SBBP repeat-containing protein [Bacteroidales bacterium]
MKKIIFSAVFLCISFMYTYAQNFVWAKSIGGQNHQYVNGIDLDSAGNVYLTGQVIGETDFDPSVNMFNLIGSGDGSAFFSKLSTNGDLVWAKIFDGGKSSSNGIDVNSSGVYYAGSFKYSPQLDGVSIFQNEPYYYNAFILKLSLNGNYQFANAIRSHYYHSNPNNPNDSLATGNSVAADVAAGNNFAYFTGHFEDTIQVGQNVYYSTNDAYDAFIAKDDLTSFSSIHFTSNDGGSAITVDAANNVYTVGYYDGGIFIKGGWIKQISGSDILVNSITTDNNGNIYITGRFSGTIDFDPGPGSNTLSGFYDAYVLKLNSSGDFVWVKKIGGSNFDEGKAICTDTSGNIYITGKFAGTADFDPSNNTFNLTSSGYLDIFVCKLDLNGDFVWAVKMGSSQNDDEGVDLCVDNNNNVYVTGTFKATADFDPGPGVFTLTPVTELYSEIFICKLSQSPEIEVLGNNIVIPNGDYTPSTNDNTYFGDVPPNTSVNKFFRINNTGSQPLYLTNNPRVSVTGSAFTLISDASPVIDPGSYAMFEVKFLPTTCEEYDGTISIANNDDDENPYIFVILGYGIDNTHPNITCKNDTTINIAAGSTYYIVQGNELDPYDYSDNCGIDTVYNSINQLSTLAGAQLNIGTHQIIWTIKDLAGFIDTCILNVTINSASAINNNNLSKVTIYPNPAENNLYIDFGNLQGNKKIIISNSLGQEIFINSTSATSTEIDIKQFSEGLYFETFAKLYYFFDISKIFA